MTIRRTASPTPRQDKRSIPIRRLPQPGYDRLRPTFAAARPERIATALRHALSRTAGDWYVIGQSVDVGLGQSLARTVAGREVALWRTEDGALHGGPGACPHLGALLDQCPIVGDRLICKWHGLPLGDNGYGSWHPYRAWDDGALIWVQLPAEASVAMTDRNPDGTTQTTQERTDQPNVPDRPPLSESVVAVITRRGVCEPEDILANRLDPWHGAWFHPYAFSHLSVDDHASSEARLVTDVTFRLGRRFGVPVRAEFVCPDRRTIVMRIIDGEGAGSVVETHATPLTKTGAPQASTMMTEITVAHSDRSGFGVARGLAVLLRPAMRHIAGRLWVDDLTYAERRYALRCRGEFPG